jgi:hypothetical protein
MKGEDAMRNIAAVIACLALLPAAASGAALTYGTTATVAHTIQAYAFRPEDASSAASHSYTGSGSLYCSGTCTVGAPVLLPSGARVVELQLEACDQLNTALVTALLAIRQAPVASINSAGFVQTGLSATPGCALFSVPVNNTTIRNADASYFVQVTLTGGDFTTQLQAVRLFYELDVSAAPATATFGDVPTSHPFFQFVEALVASGITAGCGGGNYCPDAALTRGQMAVFLSKALGLHFAP